jgi:hypothetical protein
MIMKLHADDHHVDALPAAVQTMQELGFDETVIDVPWAAGLDIAAEVLTACLSAVGQRDETEKQKQP